MKRLTDQRLKEVADIIKKELPGYGFSLIAFSFNEQPSEVRYISNAQRSDMLMSLQELLNKWKAQKPENN